MPWQMLLWEACHRKEILIKLLAKRKHLTYLVSGSNGRKIRFSVIISFYLKVGIVKIILKCFTAAIEFLFSFLFV